MADSIRGTSTSPAIRNLLRGFYAEDETDQAELRRAQQQRNADNASARELNRIASTFLGGRDRNIPQADPVKDLEAQRALRDSQRAARTQAREQSEGTASLAAYLQRQGISAEDAQTMARNPRLMQTWDSGRTRQEERTFRAGESEKDRALRAQEGARNRVNQRALAGQKGARSGAPGSGSKRGESLGPGSEKLLQTLGNEIRTAEPLMGNIQELERIAAQPGDIPGAGPFDSRIPSWLRGEESTNVDQRVNAVVNRLLQIQSGAAVSEPEVARKRAELGMGTGQSEKAFRSGVTRLREDYDKTMRGLLNQMPPEVVREYRRRGGTMPPGFDGARQTDAPSGGFDLGPTMSDEDQAALDWANENPGDPRAAAIFERLGMTDG